MLPCHRRIIKCIGDVLSDWLQLSAGMLAAGVIPWPTDVRDFD